ncbi:MAG: hypothetical protein F4Y20_02580 [Acidobacteria bacterium]|nr:hypothetical protein [Acidobacteriota bacterium]MYH22163.1 hypothetical protein [Acidobacteriota bacterium]MYK80658.1 hypothetical protein [Acidobacteriota bacterium]
MPDARQPAPGIFVAGATGAVDRLLKRRGAKELPKEALNRYAGRDFQLGWLFPAETEDGTKFDLHVLLGTGFPYEAPRIALADPPPTLTWPHVERDGLLCIRRPEQPVPRENPEGVVVWYLGQAMALVRENCQRGDAAFRDEFLSYWQIAVSEGGGAVNFVSLVEPKGPSRQVSVWRRGKEGVVAEDKRTLQRWLGRTGKTGRDKQAGSFLDAALLWLPAPLVPAEYPESAGDVRSLVGRSGPEARSVVEALLPPLPRSLWILLGMQSENGVCFGMVEIPHPRSARRAEGKRDPVSSGFRRGKVPGHVLYGRYLSGGSRAAKSAVQRADHYWIHGRDRDPNQERIRSARVAVVGCGSLGGPVARLLAQVGVGRLLLVDHDPLAWANLSRHVLGAWSVNKNKAAALAAEIHIAYPHIEEVSVQEKPLRVNAEGCIQKMGHCDVIVDATGNWAASNLLNDLQQVNPDFPPVVYAWMEERAAVAHALVLKHGGPCLRCGFSASGEAATPVTDWAEAPLNEQTPECGGAFSSYGAAELAWAHALVLDAVLAALYGDVDSRNHRVWIGSRARLEAAGAQLAASWIAREGDPGRGELQISRQWCSASDCEVCGSPTIEATT